jgi:hypothetical protein
MSNSLNCNRFYISEEARTKLGGVVPTIKNLRVRDKKMEDVFEKGFFLNAELLSAGLADPMS